MFSVKIAPNILNNVENLFSTFTAVSLATSRIKSAYKAVELSATDAFVFNRGFCINDSGYSGHSPELCPSLRRRAPGSRPVWTSTSPYHITTKCHQLCYVDHVVIPGHCYPTIRIDMQPFRTTFGSPVPTYPTILAAACWVHPHHFIAPEQHNLVFGIMDRGSSSRVHNRFGKSHPLLFTVDRAFLLQGLSTHTSNI